MQYQSPTNQGDSSSNNSSNNTTNSNNGSKRPFTIQGLDILGGKFDLTFKTTSGKFQTQLGGYVTLAVSILSTACFLFIMSQYFNKNIPVVTTSTEFGSKVNEFNLYEEQLFTPVGLSAGSNPIPPAEMGKYVTFITNIDEVLYNFTTQRFDGGLETQVPFVPCSTITDERVKEVLVQVASLEELQKNLVCPDFSGKIQNYYIKSNVTTAHLYRTVGIKVYPCSLPDPSQCATPAEMAGLQIQYGTRSRLLVPDNYEEPVKDTFTVANTKIDIKVTKNIEHVVKRNRIFDDTIQFIKPKLNKEFGSPHVVTNDFVLRNPGQMHCTKAQIAMGLIGWCFEYITLNYQSSGEVIVTRRNYKKFTTMLGEFGGILKILTTFVFFAYSFYNFRQVKRFLKFRMIDLSEGSYKAIKRLLARSNHTLKDNKESELAQAEKYGLPSNREKGKEKNKASTDSDMIIDECLKSRSSIVDLMNKLNVLELLEETMFTESEKKLILLVLMISKQEEEQLQEQEKREREGSIK